MNVQPRLEETGSGPRQDRVVVGVDGTRTGLNAVRWAVVEASLRGLALHIVHAAPYATHPGGPDARHVQGILGAAFTVAHRTAPGVAVFHRLHGDRRRDRPDRGRRDRPVAGRGNSDRGSVPRCCRPRSRSTSPAGRPARSRSSAGRIRATDEPVLAGIDDPDTDDAVLAAAFAEANLHRCGLVVLHAHGGLREHLPGHPDLAAAGARLGAAARSWSDRYPQVQVSIRTPHDSPTNALLAAASPPASSWSAPGDGTPPPARCSARTSRELVRHSPVPVLVVDPGARCPTPSPAAVAPATQT